MAEENSPSVYEDTLRISNLVHAAHLLADEMPELHLKGAPPIVFLLEEALQGLDRLEHRVSG
jgi:hypothetical protein